MPEHDRSHNPLGRIEEALERLEEQFNQLQFEVGFETAELSSKLDKVLGLLTQETAPATAGKIFQLGEPNMAITGTKVGGTSTFQVVWNGGMTPGAAVTWTSDDASIVLTPVASDPTGNTVQAVDGPGDTSTSYNLMVTGTASDGTAVKATANVPMLATPATGGTINQLS